ncbi:MAG: VCBS repeat-containing protein [Proteobacteria bacterium]|nr:VCBS repeat-containing protein [Pseudomonadota bacterium]
MKKHCLLAISICLLTIGLSACGDDSNSGPQNCQGDNCKPDDITIDDQNPKCETVQCGDVCCEKGEICDKTNHCKVPCETVECGGVCCKEGEVCDSNQCKDACKTVECGGVCCEEGEICDKTNHCKIPCKTVECGGICCQEGEFCDEFNHCTETCKNAECDGFCCSEGEICDEFNNCMMPCKQEETTCPVAAESMTVCCAEGFLCLETGCRLDCGSNAYCNGICCESGEVCEDSKCKPQCLGTRCGVNEELCCSSEEACIYNKCLLRGKTCASVNDCKYDEFCEETTKTCISIKEDPYLCVVLPTAGKFEPQLQWHWPVDLPGGKPSTDPDYDEVLDTPIAINVTDDNGDGKVDEYDIPDVIFSSRNINLGEGSYYKVPGVVRVISGDDGHEIASSQPIYYPAENLAAADIDGDGKIEIVATTIAQTQNRVDLLNVIPDNQSPTGYKLAPKASANVSYSLDAIGGMTDSSIADLDGDGVAEIISNQGILKFDKASGTLSWHCQKKMGFRPIPVDLDGDKKLELVAGGVFDLDCNELISGSKKSREYWAVADLIDSGKDASETGELVPEIVRTYYTDRAPGKVEIWKLYKKDGNWSYQVARTAEIPINAARAQSELNLNCATSPTAYNCLAGGGAPVIADFNGDQRPDIGFASRWYYIVYSNKDDKLDILWADSNIHDYTSAATGSSVFDFEGDGVAEVVYADEFNLHIYSGLGAQEDKDGDGYPDADPIFSEPNSNGTLTEYPIIVDVDNDGSTEIVVASTRYSGAPKSIYGVRAFEDPNGRWVRTRRIWNQHNYFVTNINEDGTVPKTPEVNWENEKLNNFRQNVQPSGMFNAPNLVAKDLVFDDKNCTADTLQFTATIENKGSLGVKAGVTLSFYAKNANNTSNDAYLGSTKVPSIIPPGGQASAKFDWDYKGKLPGQDERTLISTPVDVYFVIDKPTEDKPFGEFIECVEDDNQSKDLPEVKCNIIN